MNVEPHMFLTRGKKRLLLVRYFDKLHFVTLDHRMTYKVRDWFLAQPRTEAEMDEKGLVRTSLKLQDVRGVAAGGTGMGQVVQFYLKDEKRRYELTKDCDLGDMSALFAGLESFAPPQKKSSWHDERLARQNPKLRNWLWPLGVLLNITSFVCGFVILGVGFESLWFVWIALLLIPLPLALYCLFPDYFNIFAEKRKYGQIKGTRGLIAPLVCSVSMIMGATGTYEYFGWWKAWLIGGVVTIVLAVLLNRAAPVFRKADQVGRLVLVGILLSGGPVLALNSLLETAPPQQIQTQVVDKEKHISSKGPDIYELTVILDGEERNIPVDSVFYEEMEIGDGVTVEVHEGAFGIPYANIR